MKTATISEAKNRLSALIDQVREGETIVITDRGRPVAQIVPARAGAGPSGDEALLAELERAGIIKRGERAPFESGALPPPVPLSGVLDALLEERREGR